MFQILRGGQARHKADVLGELQLGFPYGPMLVLQVELRKWLLCVLQTSSGYEGDCQKHGVLRQHVQLHLRMGVLHYQYLLGI